MYTTDTKKIEEAKKLLDKVEYKVLSKRKDVKAKMGEDSQFAFDLYQEDMQNIFDIEGVHIFHVKNNNRDFINIFKDASLDTLDESVNIKGLTGDEMKLIGDVVSLDVDNGSYRYSAKFFLENECDKDYYPEAHRDAEKAIKKLEQKLSIFEVEARGYSQGDWDKYTFVYYAETKEAEEEFLGYAKQLEDIFTVCEYIATMEEYEKREYRNGDIDEVLVSEDNCGFISYDGDIPEGDIADWAGVEVGEVVASDY